MFAIEIDVEKEPICELTLSELPYATEVLSFVPGLNAGFGESEFPEVVLGLPKGGGGESGSLHVLSLGVAGEIVLTFGERRIIDGEGPDFVIFENPFAIGGDASNPFAELAQVSVSNDGENWISFGCDSAGDYPWTGCAGWQLVNKFEGCATHIDSGATGGDLFDLQDLGIEEVRFIRIIDFIFCNPINKES
mgnify:CR=1 FL=1